MTQLAIHQLKELWRSKFWRSNWAVTLFTCFILVYLVATLALIGYVFHLILKHLFPSLDVEYAFCGYFIYYLATASIIRFTMSKLPILSIQPYLLLPIPKSQLVHYILLRSLLNIYNFLPLLIIIPFSIKGIYPTYGLTKSLLWGISIYLFTLCNSMFISYIKLISRQYLKPFLYTLCVYITVYILDYLEIISIAKISTHTFIFFLENAWGAVIPASILLICYKLNFNVLYNETQLFKPEKKLKADNLTKLAWLENMGEVGMYIRLEIRMILRNKFSRGMLFSFLPITLIFAFIGISNEYSIWANLQIAILINGAFMINYGQFILSWEGNYLEGLLVRNVNLKKYYFAKLTIMVSMSTICYLCACIASITSPEWLKLNTAAYIYCIGTGNFIYLGFSVYNRKKVDLNASHFNWQSVGKSQVLVNLPLMLIPYMVFLPFWVFNKQQEGLIAIGVTGIISLLLTPIWLKEISDKIQSTKYEILQAFKQS